ncbi:DUF92 domain-containing protein [Bacillus sp. T3]|uniref:DUF92 domain-containing protein n=1 Tax=Bacillus sp. T3 TaxID=467262 RepID=UPI002980DC7A|nr:DUF92 domain-containing protein [Bacillus sp. T3]
MTKLLICFILLISVIYGYFKRYLTFSGAVAAFFVGGAVVLAFGFRGLIVLGVFFATSSQWSKYKQVYKQQVEQKLEKGSRRDWQQVVANGGVAAVAAIFFYFDQQEFWIYMFCISIASANSDTWASEIGTLSKRPPLFIRTLKIVEKGTSGAVSWLGTSAALAGSLLIALVSMLLFHLSTNEFLFVFILGFLGNVFDTLFGAFLQVTYVCQHCGAETEKKLHCAQPTVKVRGLKMMNNEAVNFISGFLASCAGIWLLK